MITTVLSCESCSWRSVCSQDATIQRIRSVGMLRRQAEPDDELIAELLPLAAAKMACPACSAIGLRIGETDGNNAQDHDAQAHDDWPRDQGSRDQWPSDQWNDAVVCEVCRQPIPPERVEAVPDATRCAACQTEAEAGREPEEPDYCPRCGSLMVLRVGNAGGVTRYKLFCTGSPPCRV